MTEKRFRVCDLVKFDYSEIGEYIGEDYTDTPLRNDEVVNLLNNLTDKNKELQERNNRQAKQLDNIYSLIEQKNWRELSDILDDFKKCEEQLQREEKLYSRDVK